MSEPRILQVLPHPGGGGDRYVELLEGVPGFAFRRLHLTPKGRPLETPIGVSRLLQEAPGADLIHIHGDAAGVAALPVLRHTSSLITLHGAHLIRRSAGIRGALVRAAARRLFARLDAVVAVSESERELARAIAPEAAARVALIENGVPPPSPADPAERARVREGLGLPPGAVAALFVGELSNRKQPLEFAHAVEAARSSDPALVGLLAGDGPLRPRLEALAGPGVRVLGSRPDVEALLRAADVFVLPSRWEGLSYALLEAMALGRAPLVSDGPGNPDGVGQAGLVFPVGDVEAMAAALLRLAREPGLREALGEAAAARVGERFTLTGMLERTSSLYRKLLAAKDESPVPSITASR